MNRKREQRAMVMTVTVCAVLGTATVAGAVTQTIAERWPLAGVAVRTLLTLAGLGVIVWLSWAAGVKFERENAGRACGVMSEDEGDGEFRS